MNLMDLFVKISVDDQASSQVETIGSKLKGGLVTAAKVGTAAVAAAGTAIVAIGKQAIEQYAEYEQLVGGVETLYGNAGKSMEQYVQEVADQVRSRGFEPDLEGIAERWKALEAVEQKVLKNASEAYRTAGLSANQYMETITGFTAALGQTIDDTSVVADYADMAVRDMSDNANKMGTSMEMIQNAYQGFSKQNYTMLDNLKLGYGGTQAEMQRLIADAAELSDTVDAQSMSFDNIVEAIHVVQTEMGITGTTAKEADTTIQGSLASMKGAWENLLTGVADDNANFKTLTEQFVDSIVTVGENIIPRINIVIQGLTQLITETSQTIIPMAVQILLENLPSVVAAGMDLIVALVSGILDNIDMLIDCVLEMVDVIVDKLIDNLPKLIEGGIRLIAALANGLIRAIPNLVSKIPQIISSIVNGLISGIPAIFDVGKNIVEGLWNGIKNMGSWVTGKVKGFFGGIVSGVKDFLGIHSPSKVFAGIGGFMAEGLGEGFDNEFSDIKKNIENSINFDAGTITADANISRRYIGGYHGAASAIGASDSGRIVMLLEQYLPMLANMKVIMDSGQVVGLLAPGMDEELSKISTRRARAV